MTVLDDALLPGIKNLLSSVGKSSGVIFWEESQSYYDATTQEQFEYPATQHNPVISPPVYENSIESEREIQRISFIIAAAEITFIPALKQEFEIDGENFRIESVEPLYSGDSICAYKISGV